jgi:nucleoside-diphosphate-sugar epimerase
MTTRTSSAVLVTGATGLVGNELIDQLLNDTTIEVVGVSRRGSRANPEIVAWDMATELPPAILRRRWGAIVNAAANTRWTMSPEEATAANVASVRALAPLVTSDTHVIHVSTAYALGLRNNAESVALEDYRNTYEWSKAHAERIARETFDHLTLVRPTLIVGRRSDGRAARFSGMYTLVRGLTVGTVPAVVANPDASFDAIPVDALALLLANLVSRGDVSDRLPLTIAAGPEAPTVHEAITVVVDSLNRWRQQHGYQPLQRPPVILPETWNRFFRPFVREHVTSRQLLILELLGNFEPYLALADPLQSDYTVEDILSCLETSTSYWAETNPKIAALTPSPWRGFDDYVGREAETSRA